MRAAEEQELVAYPRLPERPTAAEAERLFTPTPKELEWALDAVASSDAESDSFVGVSGNLPEGRSSLDKALSVEQLGHWQ